MNPHFFLNRPVLSGVLSVLLMLWGAIGIYNMPVEQFPEISPPTIRVTATYTGAHAETLMKSVVAPLEEAINGVENMAYMSSTANNNGTATIDCFFRPGTQSDMALVNVQNRLATAQGALPEDVIRNGISVRKTQTSTAKIISLMSPGGVFDQNYLSNYFKINIEPRLARIPGVGGLTIFGTDYALRIWLKPDKMASYGLVPADIEAVLDAQNRESPTGALGAQSGHTFQYILRYRGRCERPEELGELVVKSLPDGEVVYLRDVADMELGASQYDRHNELVGCPGVNCMIAQTPGTNAHEILRRVDAVVADAGKALPEGMELVELMSVEAFLHASMETVWHTLWEAFILVVLVVLLFLQDIRASLVPAVAIAVSLVATFAVLWVLGFSLNLLTLFALVLVIGTVVDDAVVVVEAVQARLEKGEDSRHATEQAMQGISPALVTTSLVFMCVFLPVCFIGGATGRFYTQFGVTMAVAVLLSLINALTLSPVLCVLLMRPARQKGFFFQLRRAFDVAFSTLLSRYRKILGGVIRHRLGVGVSLALVIAALAWLVQHTRTGFIPDEDTGTIVVDVQTSPGSSLEETRRILARVEKYIRETPQVQVYSQSVGMNMLAGQGASNGTFIIRLKPWAERTAAGDSNKAVMSSLNQRMRNITDARIIIFSQPVIAGYGVTNGFQLQVQDNHGGTAGELQQVADSLASALAGRPEIAQAQSNANGRYPQWEVEVDAALCLRHGMSPAMVLDTLSSYVGGSYCSDINRFSRLYHVIMQAPPESRTDENSLSGLYVRTGSGEMAPLSRYVSLKRVYGSETLSRFNLFPSLTINGLPAAGYSSGQAMEAIHEVARRMLPRGYGYEFSGLTREEAEQGNSPLIIFVLCVVFIYLILCALYESLLIPLAVLLPLPFGLAGSFLFTRWFGWENNIYMQTGVIMLVGLLAKTSILMTEYATRTRRAGYSIPRAALMAASVRLRPILMTSSTMVIGLLPLAFATGAGANGSRSLGIGVIGGMLAGTLSLLVLTPVFFMMLQPVEERLFQRKKEGRIER